MVWNLQSYPTTVLNKRMWYFGGRNILWPLLYIFMGSGPPPHTWSTPQFTFTFTLVAVREEMNDATNWWRRSETVGRTGHNATWPCDISSPETACRTRRRMSGWRSPATWPCCPCRRNCWRPAPAAPGMFPASHAPFARSSHINEWVSE